MDNNNCVDRSVLRITSSFPIMFLHRNSVVTCSFVRVDSVVVDTQHFIALNERSVVMVCGSLALFFSSIGFHFVSSCFLSSVSPTRIEDNFVCDVDGPDSEAKQPKVVVAFIDEKWSNTHTLGCGFAESNTHYDHIGH